MNAAPNIIIYIYLNILNRYNLLHVLIQYIKIYYNFI